MVGTRTPQRDPQRGPQRGPRPPAADDGLSWRDRLLPHSVLGISVLILAFAVGAGFSGAIFYAYYEFKKDTTDQKVATFVRGFDKRFKAATSTIDAERENAKAEIQEQLEPLRKIRVEGEGLDELVKKVQPSVFFVSTLDEAGQPSVGSAFAVASDAEQTLVLASYTTVRAATRKPGPAVKVRRGAEELTATVWTWQEDKDLALLTVPKGSIPTLPFAPKDPPIKIGERLFALAGVGGAGAAVTQGFVADVSAAGIQHDAAIGQAFQGGPLLNADGAVLGVASRSYAPLGFTSDGVFFAPLVRSACEKVLKCPSGEPGGPGARR